MTRLLLTILLPLIIPSAAYLLWLAATGRALPAGGAAALPWVWLVGAGLVLTALTLFLVSIHYGSTINGTYVPPHIVGDAVVPGQVIPGVRP